jgi:hypothetical protein
MRLSKEQAMSPDRYSVFTHLAAAAAVVLNACVGALKYLGAMHGIDARAWFPTTEPHAFYGGRKRNRSPGIAREDGTALEIAIDDDGLPARPAVPWLPIPRGLGLAVRDNPDLTQILRFPHDRAASSNARATKAQDLAVPSPSPHPMRTRIPARISVDRGRVQSIPVSLVSRDQGIKPAHLRYCMEEDGTIAPSHRRHRR